MNGKKISITVSDEQYESIEKMAEANGLRVAAFLKSEAVKSTKEICGKRRIFVDVDNYSEISEYAASKKFGNVESFITFAVCQYMTRYPINSKKTAQI